MFAETSLRKIITDIAIWADAAAGSLGVVGSQLEVARIGGLIGSFISRHWYFIIFYHVLLAFPGWSEKSNGNALGCTHIDSEIRVLGVRMVKLLIDSPESAPGFCWPTTFGIMCSSPLYTTCHSNDSNRFGHSYLKFADEWPRKPAKSHDADTTDPL